jgi:hypothetical protein
MGRGSRLPGRGAVKPVQAAGRNGKNRAGVSAGQIGQSHDDAVRGPASFARCSLASLKALLNRSPAAQCPLPIFTLESDSAWLNFGQFQA